MEGIKSGDCCTGASTIDASIAETSPRISGDDKYYSKLRKKMKCRVENPGIEQFEFFEASKTSELTFFNG